MVSGWVPAESPSAMSSSATARRLRAFKRWMKSQAIDCSDALEIRHSLDNGLAVYAKCDLEEGDVVATIPKNSCLTVKTSAAKKIIEDCGFEGVLGLCFALMYEISLGGASPWASYLHLLPEFESLPFVWSVAEVDSLLSGTELHKIVKEDKALIYEDWKENILPLMNSASLNLSLDFFGVERYVAAKSLVASRSFRIDDYHGFGMVPLADLFNHKTGAENVHFTSVLSDGDSDNDVYSRDEGKNIGHNEPSVQNSLEDSNLEGSSKLGDDSTVLEMIIVKSVKAGVEIFNTYGCMGNAGLLHRYGFTEPDNPDDIVNIDLELVLHWSSALFSDRYSRQRLALWRRLDYSGCVSQNSEYFEISPNGEPQIELLILLYIMLLPEEAYHKLDLVSSTTGNLSAPSHLLETGSISLGKFSEMSEEFLLTKSVCDALLSLADARESLYGSNSVDDDIDALRSCIGDQKLYHSLVLRVSERAILNKLRTYAATAKRTISGKKLKKT